MAGKDIVHLDINFPGVVLSETCKFLFTEIIKQLLYQREQIPLPFDQLRYAVENSKAGGKKLDLVPRRASEVTDHAILTSPPVTNNRNLKSQVLNAYEGYSSLFQHLSDVFGFAEVHEMVVLLGPTIVSPRECYHIQWTRDVCSEHELPKLSTRKCMGMLFKEMITNSCLWSTKPTPITNVTVLLKLNTLSSCVEYLEPMLTFNPLRSVSKQVTISLNKQCTECTSEILCNNEVLDNGIKTEKLPATSSGGPDDLLWYKVSPTVKGLKDTAFKK